MTRQAEEARDPVLSLYVYRRLMARMGKQTGKAVAARYGVSASTISSIKGGRGEYGVARKACERLLPLLGHKTYTELLSAAYAAARGEAAAPEYPSLATLLGRSRAQWSEAAIAAVLLLRPDTDPGEKEWRLRLDAIDATIKLIESHEAPSASDDLRKRQKR